MYNFREVTLLITHYNRSNSLERLLTTFNDLHCRFSDIVVSDDCSIAPHIDKLNALKEKYGFKLITTPSNRGLGNNLNKGQDAVSTPYTLYVQEDFVPSLVFPGKFERALEFMNNKTDLDIVRFHAYFKYPFLKTLSDGFAEMIFNPWPWKGYLKFYYYSDHPHLRRSNFFSKFGRYAEGKHGDVTEYMMMMSFLKKHGRGLFYENFRELFAQVNTSDEPTTMKRNVLRESNNFFIKHVRNFYRYIKFNFDLHAN
ncbi:MAG: glycosyltransferase [Pyrinomonadaceae bacterium]|nr:glycosyltransferase [Sphingobacteriaceae bacterium]